MSNFLPAISSPSCTYGPEINAENSQNQLNSTPGDALALAARTEKTWCLKLLDTLKAFIVRVKTSVRAWMDKPLNRPSINEALSSLTTTQELGTVLGGLMHFARNTEKDWAKSCQKGTKFKGEILKPEDHLDAVKRQNFLADRLLTHIKELDETEQQEILRQLEGEVGMRIRSVIDAVAHTFSSRVDDDESKEARIFSRLSRISTLLVGLIDELHTRLGTPLRKAVPDAPIIELHQLKPQERTTLMDIRIYPN